MENVKEYLDRILSEIELYDSLHSKTLKGSLDRRQSRNFNHLKDIVCGYFLQKKIPAVQVAHDYLHMIRDMRREGIYFNKHNEYRCKSQKEAFDKCYSDLVVMSYYMNALMISQLLWVHHFDMLEYFRRRLEDDTDGGGRVLDVGAGHGLFSKMIQEEISDFQCIDIIDISEDSLEMSKMILGNEKVNYYQNDITTNINFTVKYDLIILGEILEHLDEPEEILSHIVNNFLHDDGCMWITVPTNAPAIDHVSLFRSEEEVFVLVENSGLVITNSHIAQADSLTHLVGVLCRKK